MTARTISNLGLYRPLPPAASPLSAQDRTAPGGIIIVSKALTVTSVNPILTPRFQLRTAHASDIGRVRKIQQDRSYESQDKTLFMVADGMGGMAGGHIASTEAVRIISTLFENFDLERRSSESLIHSIQTASDLIKKHGMRETELSGMGTTVVALHIDPLSGKGFIGHVGDSRAYRIREALIQLTQDHSIGMDIQRDFLPVEYLKQLQMQIPNEPLVYLENNISRWVGSEQVQVEITNLSSIRKGDLFLLCSDGLSNRLSADEIHETILANRSDLNEAAKALVRLANDHGGYDNISVILVEVV